MRNLSFLFLLTLMIIRPAAARCQSPAASYGEAREARLAIEGVYEAWGSVRLSYDRAAMERMLSGGFYVLLDGSRISREEFIEGISRKGRVRRLTRFDTDILTVERSDEGWTVVISEKIEVEAPGEDGRPATFCHHWITRDGLKEEDGKWSILFSEAIGHEKWPAGETPPISCWR